MAFFTWLEDSSFSTWLKTSESIWPFDIFCLSFHAIGMAFVVGISSAVALRILGFAPDLPLAPMEKFFPFMYAGFWVNAVSGAGLFIAYPVRAVTNPGFYIKMGGVALALVCIWKIRRQVFGDPMCQGTRPVPANGKTLARALLFIWLGTVTAGRLMAYHGVGSIEWQAPIAVLVVTGVIVFGVYTVPSLFGGGQPAEARSRVDA